MRNIHEPQDAFVERLEAQVGAEIRRRNRMAAPVGWPGPSRLKLAAAAIGLVIVSMSIGGAAVAAAYQAQSNEQRSLLVLRFDERVSLARLQVALADKVQKDIAIKVNIGLATPLDLMESRIAHAQAEAQVKSLELQLAEVRVTGREPLSDISAPLVSGRDFVSERLRADLSVPEATLQFENARLKDAQTRVLIGALEPIEVQVAQIRTGETEMVIEAIRRKLAIRQQFLKSEIDAVQAGLRVLESDADLRRRALVPKIELAKKEVERITTRVEVGMAAQVELAQATMRLQQLNLDLAKVAVDLAVIRLRLSGKEPGDVLR